MLVQARTVHIRRSPQSGVVGQARPRAPVGTVPGRPGTVHRVPIPVHCGRRRCGSGRRRGREPRPGWGRRWGRSQRLGSGQRPGWGRWWESVPTRRHRPWPAVGRRHRGPRLPDRAMVRTEGGPARWSGDRGQRHSGRAPRRATVDCHGALRLVGPAGPAGRGWVLVGPVRGSWVDGAQPMLGRCPRTPHRPRFVCLMWTVGPATLHPSGRAIHSRIR